MCKRTSASGQNDLMTHFTMMVTDQLRYVGIKRLAATSPKYGDYNSALAVQQILADVDRAFKNGNHYGPRKQKRNKVITNQYGTGNSAAASQ